MDEFVFRCSQKLDNLQVDSFLQNPKKPDNFFQIRLGIYTADLRDILQQLVGQSRMRLSQFVDEVKMVDLSNSVRNGWVSVVSRGAVISRKLIELPKEAYEKVVASFLQQCSKHNLNVVKIGFFVGTVTGVAIGYYMFRPKSPSRIRHMNAILCTSYTDGHPGKEGVEIVDNALIPCKVGPDEVMVELKAASVQRVDALICRGYGRVLRQILCSFYNYSNSELPVTLGRDCTGVITQCGYNVNRFDVGDEVWLTVPFWAPGTMSQYLVVHHKRVGLKPINLTYESAAAIPYGGCCALAALEVAQLSTANSKGKRVLVLGGSSPVGSMLVQILTAWGSNVYVTCPLRRAPQLENIFNIPKENFLVDISFPEDLKLDHGNWNVKTVRQHILALQDIDYVFMTQHYIVGKKTIGQCLTDDGVCVFAMEERVASDSYGPVRRFLYGMYVKCWATYQRFIGEDIGEFEDVHMCFGKLRILQSLAEAKLLLPVYDDLFTPGYIPEALQAVENEVSLGPPVITFRL